MSAAEPGQRDPETMTVAEILAEVEATLERCEALILTRYEVAQARREKRAQFTLIQGGREG